MRSLYLIFLYDSLLFWCKHDNRCLMHWYLMEYLFCCASVCFVAATVVTHMAKYGLLSKSLQHQMAEIEGWISERFPLKLKVEFLNVSTEIESWISWRFPVKLKVEFLKGSQWNWKLNFSNVSAEIELNFSKVFHWNWKLNFSKVSLWPRLYFAWYCILTICKWCLCQPQICLAWQSMVYCQGLHCIR